MNKLRLLLAFRKEIDMKIKSPPDPKPLVFKETFSVGFADWIKKLFNIK